MSISCETGNGTCHISHEVAMVEVLAKTRPQGPFRSVSSSSITMPLFSSHKSLRKKSLWKERVTQPLLFVFILPFKLISAQYDGNTRPSNRSLIFTFPGSFTFIFGFAAEALDVVVAFDRPLVVDGGLGCGGAFVIIVSRFGILLFAEGAFILLVPPSSLLIIGSVLVLHS